jgi:hypothetical protein
VLPIKYEETKDWLLNVHYLKRMPPMNYAFGMFDDSGDVLGIVTFGVPASGPLCRGICGDQWERNVLELNRMCFVEPIKNGPSRLVSGAIKQLPRPTIIVSYADTGEGHVGKVYQACNFIYTGKSAERTDWKTEEGKHARSARPTEERVQRSSKHRYVFIHANKSDRKQIMRDLNYKIEPYPNGTPERYEINYKPTTQGTLL